MDLEEMASCSEDGDVLDINIHDSDDEYPDGSWPTNPAGTEEPREFAAPVKPRAPPGEGSSRMPAMRGRGNPNRVVRRQPGHGFRSIGRSTVLGWGTRTIHQSPIATVVSPQPRLGQQSPWLPGHAPGMQPAGPGLLSIVPSIPVGMANVQTSGSNVEPFLLTNLAATKIGHLAATNVSQMTETDIGQLAAMHMSPEVAANLDYKTKRRLLNGLLDTLMSKRKAEDAQILRSADPAQWQGRTPLPHPLSQDLQLPDGQNIWNRLGPSLTPWKPQSLGLRTLNPEEVNKQQILKRGLAAVAPMQRRSGGRLIISPVNNAPSSLQFQQTPSRANSAGWTSTPFNRTYRSAGGTNFTERRGFGLQRSRVLRSKPQHSKNLLNRPIIKSETLVKSEQIENSTQGSDTNLSEHPNSISDQSTFQNVDASTSESLAETLVEPEAESGQLEVTADSLSVELNSLHSMAAQIETQHSAALLPEPQISVSTLSVPQKPALQTVPQHPVTAVPEASTVSTQREPQQTELLLSVASVLPEILVPQPAVPPKTETQLSAPISLPAPISLSAPISLPAPISLSAPISLPAPISLSAPISQSDKSEARESVQSQHQHSVPGTSQYHPETRQPEVAQSGPCQYAERGRSESQQPYCACSNCRPLKLKRPIARCEHPLHDSKCPDCIRSDSDRSNLRNEHFHRSSSPFGSLRQSRSRRSGSSSSDCSSQCYRIALQEEQARFLNRREQELIRIERERRHEVRRLQALRWQQRRESACHKRYHGGSRSPESYGRHRSDRYSPESRRYESNGYRPRDYDHRRHFERGHSEDNPYKFRHRAEHFHREPKHYHPEDFSPEHRRLQGNSFQQTARSTECHSGNTIELECPRMDLQRQPTRVKDVGGASSGAGATRERHGTCSIEPSADLQQVAVKRDTAAESCPSSAPNPGVEQNFAAILEKLEAEMQRVKQAILQKQPDAQIPPHP